MDMKYTIKKDGKYLSSLFPFKFEAEQPTMGTIYWYRIKLIAEDVARQLGAKVETIS